MKFFIVLAALLWLLLSWFANSVGLKAEEITTGNLLTNGNFETGNANGWTTNGDVQVLNDCFKFFSFSLRFLFLFKLYILFICRHFVIIFINY